MICTTVAAFQRVGPSPDDPPKPAWSHPVGGAWYVDQRAIVRKDGLRHCSRTLHSYPFKDHCCRPTRGQPIEIERRRQQRARSRKNQVTAGRIATITAVLDQRVVLAGFQRKHPDVTHM